MARLQRPSRRARPGPLPGPQAGLPGLLPRRALPVGRRPSSPGKKRR
ncbi:MAG: hypothetical protein M0C28_42920 [Candidatus Moduliflexus flocculans]|nr:hypothetical protein [Candidatus Moduliflexus flocculans]